MLNNVVIMGRMTKDPELKRTPGGTAVTSFTLAVDRDFKAQDGTRQTDFIDVVAWKQTAEFVCSYFSKGRMAVVDGRLQVRDWTDKDGNKRKAVEVIADHIYFADSKTDQTQNRENLSARMSEFESNGEQIEEISDDGNLPF